MRYLCLLVAVLIPACSSVPQRFEPPSTAVVHSRIADVKTKISSAQGDAASAKASIASARKLGEANIELVVHLDIATKRIDSLTQSLLDAQTYATDADIKLTEADKKMRTITDQANKAVYERDVAVKKYHRLKIPLCLLLVAAAGFLLWKFKVPLLAMGWLGIGIIALTPIAVFGASWWFL